MSNFPNRRWLVIPASQVENVDFSQVLEGSAQSLRYSIDNSKTFIKYEIYELLEDDTKVIVNPETGETETITIPAGVYGRPSIYQEGMIEYNHAEILELLATEEWTNPVKENL
jgi:hypothetical protein